jgi:hypothetical protein
MSAKNKTQEQLVDAYIVAVLHLPEIEQLRRLESESHDILFARLYEYLLRCPLLTEQSSLKEVLTKYFESGLWARRLREAMERECVDA